VGKTVLLNRFRDLAEADEWITLETEVDQTTRLGLSMARLCRKALLSLDAPSRWKNRALRAARVLTSFTMTVDPEGSISFGNVDLEPLAGRGDSGSLPEDLTEVFLDLGEAAREKETGVVFLIDEIQFLPQRDLEALILALHKVAQRRLPLTLVAAGLPQIPKLAGDAKSYAERLFAFPQIGRLAPDAARHALTDPAEAQGVSIDPEALDLALDFTDGYPYFLQELGNAVWDFGVDDRITRVHMELAVPEVTRKLDNSFFRVRVDRCTELELAYLRAMAELGAGPHKSGEIATVLGYRGSEQLGATRANLITKGLICTPSHGFADFTVPQFDTFLRRYMEFEKKTPRSKRH
jgi:hypothetical protein